MECSIICPTCEEKRVVPIVTANVDLVQRNPEQSTPITERMPRPNPWFDMFKEPIERSSGLEPCPGHEWRNSTASYRTTGDPNETQGNRLRALEDLADLLQQNAKEQGGRPEDWRVIVLKGWWMKECIVPGGVMYIDCTYAIVPK